jgi:hypothetical protein
MRRYIAALALAALASGLGAAVVSVPAGHHATVPAQTRTTGLYMGEHSRTVIQ